MQHMKSSLRRLVLKPLLANKIKALSALVALGVFTLWIFPVLVTPSLTRVLEVIA